MNNKTSSKIIKLKIKDNYRLIAISDIHGHLDIFRALLDSVKLRDEDYLIIIGDFINKGVDSLATLRYMMELSKRPRTVILKGNHEYFICNYVFKEVGDPKFLDYLRKEYFETIIHTALRAENISVHDSISMDEVNALLLSTFRSEFDFINNLPVIAFIDDCIFVHGGYDKKVDIENDEYALLKFDNFNELSEVHDSRIIVGHWPTSNLRKNRNSNAPLFNNEKNIISIDGGIGVKSSGELNALVISKKDGHTSIIYKQENSFDIGTIKHSHTFEQEDRIFVNYPHFDIEVIEEGPQLTLCRHVQSGKTLSIFNSLLETIDGKPQVITTYINHFLNLKVGDMVEVCMTYDDCALVKHQEEFGWVLNTQL